MTRLIRLASRGFPAPLQKGLRTWAGNANLGFLRGSLRVWSLARRVVPPQVRGTRTVPLSVSASPDSRLLPRLIRLALEAILTAAAFTALAWLLIALAAIGGAL